MNSPSFLSIQELEAMCYPLTQPAAIRRWVEREYRITVTRKMPSGHPLILRSELEGGTTTEAPRPNRDRFRSHIQQRKAA